MKKAMTSGNPVKQILTFSLPLMLGNLFQQAYNMADAAIVGQTMGNDALGSVGVSSSVQFLVLGFCTGVAIGFGIPIATQFGANHIKKMKQYIYIGGILTAIIAVIFTIITVVLCKPILNLLQTPEALYSNAYDYLVTIFAGIPCTLLYNYLSAMLRSVGDSKTPFLFLAFSAVLNIFLDLFCILNLNMGVFGAAFATVVSQGISGVLCFVYILKKVPLLHPEKENCKWDSEMARHSFNMGVPMGLQYSITAIGSMVMQTANNSLGTTYVNAYAAGLKIKQFMMCPFDAFATATATFASQNYGAENPKRIKQGIKIGWLTAVIYGVLAGFVMNLFGKNLALLFLDESSMESLNAATQYLGLIGLFYPALGTLNVLRQTIQGLGWSRRAMLFGVIEMIARCIVCIGLTPALGFTAICWADQSAWCSADLFILFALHARLKLIDQEFPETKTA